VLYIADGFNNRIRKVTLPPSVVNGSTVIKSTQPSVCPGQSVSFSDSSSFIVTNWQWSFPGGSPSSANTSNPSVSYNSGGTYDVILRVSNNCNSAVDTLKNYITVSAGATINT